MWSSNIVFGDYIQIKLYRIYIKKIMKLKSKSGKVSKKDIADKIVETPEMVQNVEIKSDVNIVVAINPPKQVPRSIESLSGDELKRYYRTGIMPK